MTPPAQRGERDVARATAELAAGLPPELAGLARLAFNYAWSWRPDGSEVFSALDPERWERCAGNPVRLLHEAPTEALLRAASDERLLGRIAALERAVSSEAAPTHERPVAFFCAEFGLHRSLPIYAGGLGALAGDALKEASDRGLPLVGVGLLYRQGAFRQVIDRSGRQHECWVQADPDRLPAALVRDAHDAPLTVTVPVFDDEVAAQIWRIDVGRVPLFLLDPDRPENARRNRWIGARLYVGDPLTRLAQYALLGIGGVRALAALGIVPELVHLNEGHAALATLELARSELAAGADLGAALGAARERVVFTTHTPVPAGNEAYTGAEVSEVLGAFAASLGLDADTLMRLGRTDPDDGAEPFGVTQLALRGSRIANAVSRSHGRLARTMWRGLWPGRSTAAVPITHVTNGVHLPTWVGAPMRELLDRHLGADWPRRAATPATWAAVDAIPDAELWEVRERQRAALVDEVRQRSVAERLARGESREYAETAARAFDPATLTLGFARRMATYKRMRLLVHDPGRIAELLGGQRPLQVVLAGKAHPSDEGGKATIAELFTLKDDPTVSTHAVFLEDYDLGLAARLVAGCDVWVNLPRPPLEASGTSGMKAVVNGGLHLSVLDGWWPEGYDGANGWALPGDIMADHDAQDARDATELYALVSEQVVPDFYDRDAQGLPHAWLARMRASMRTLAPEFCAGRMLDDYAERVYRL